MKKFIPVLFFLVLISCRISYQFNGAKVDYTKTKTMSIQNFQIRSALVYAPLAPAFNEALQDKFTRQTRLTMVKQNGDIQIDGEITGYDITPQAIKENAYASETRLTITVKVRYKNAANPKLDLDRSFSAYRDFPSSSMLTQVQDELIKQIVEQLADEIFNATLGTW